ncbi:copper resistance CopC/CopD family protein [Xanthobacter oligotrophicus]|uniref:copper resistance CopC/CopD family protein n=1 Tax=Xanthobacter oligotrophicus TaxID=2607286 RepID=UPI001E4CDE68|nr:copper resistance protein CopC [Xanthobacter oligotrophicus]MCG5235525.1 copper resistance protein CopC [Xanthobacter oligotrophicus]
MVATIRCLPRQFTVHSVARPAAGGKAAVAAGVRRLLQALLIMVGALAFAGDALAHASLVHSEPADGAMVAREPRAFVLTFSEPISPLVLRLVGPDGAAVTLDRFVQWGATLDVEAPAGLPNGTHVLAWRVVSDDGHPVGGAVVFSIGAPSPGVSAAAVDVIDWPVRMAIWLARFTLYAGLFVGVGGAFFANWIGAPSRLATRLGAGVIVAGLVAVPLSVGVQGLDALGATLRNLPEPVVWRAGFSTSYGVTAQLALLALALGLGAFGLKGIAGKLLSLAALLLAGCALAASGHASAAHPQGLTRPAVFLHAVGIAVWAGALIPLGAAFASRSPDAAAALRCFSVLAPFAVLPLVAAGLMLAVIQLGSLDALWTTAYGAVLLVKAGLLVPLFALAVVNRVRLTAPAERGEATAIARLRRSIRAEIVLIFAIFAVAAVWRFTPPPRVLAVIAAEPASVHIHTGAAMADLSIAPGRAGPVSASIVVLTGEFGPLDAKGVTLILSNPAAGIGPIRRPATKPGDGTWRVDDITLPQGGRWSVGIEILGPDGAPSALSGEIEIRP